MYKANLTASLAGLSLGSNSGTLPEGIALDRQVLTFGKSELKGDETLQSHGVTDMSTMHLTLRVVRVMKHLCDDRCRTRFAKQGFVPNRYAAYASKKSDHITGYRGVKFVPCQRGHAFQPSVQAGDIVVLMANTAHHDRGTISKGDDSPLLFMYCDRSYRVQRDKVLYFAPVDPTTPKELNVKYVPVNKLLATISRSSR